MSNIIIISVVSFFALLGIYYIVREITGALLKEEPAFVLLTVKNRENDIEYSIRSLLLKYPESDIIVTDNSSEDKTMEIARRMSLMYDRVHIK